MLDEADVILLKSVSLYRSGGNTLLTFAQSDLGGATEAQQVTDESAPEDPAE